MNQKNEKFQQDLINLVGIYHNALGMRWGQSHFNALYAMDPELAEIIRGGEFDPFYNDGLVPAFMQEIFGN